MHIVYFSPHPHLNLAAPSGPGTHMREVIRGFEDAGHTVVPVIMGGTSLSQDAGNRQMGGWKARIRSLIPGLLWQSLKDRRLMAFDQHAKQQLLEVVAREKPDLIYERGYYLMRSGIEAAKQAGIKHAIELNAPYPEEKVYMEGKSMFLHKANDAERFQALKSDAIVVVSSALKEYLMKRTGVEASKILVTPNAVNTALFPSDTDKWKARKNMGYAEHDIVVGFVGSIFPYHGVDHLIQAFDEAAKQLPMLRLHIVGDGETMTEIKALAERMPSKSSIRFVGKVNHAEVVDHVAAMDIGVMPKSNWYGSPVKIFEYGMLRCVVVGPNNGPMRDVIRHRENGWLISNQVQDLSNALTVLANDANMRNHLANAFYDQIIQQHTWRAVSESILSHCMNA
ncbi:MAG: glycosyltransferase family 4 protein [Flavobacteriales bacterium]|nr:glycosyltransferase family 4 protein [Flavobacteriales bacterium]